MLSRVSPAHYAELLVHMHYRRGAVDIRQIAKDPIGRSIPRACVPMQNMRAGVAPLLVSTVFVVAVLALWAIPESLVGNEDARVNRSSTAVGVTVRPGAQCTHERMDEHWCVTKRQYRGTF
jgi:hypothetical protein